MKEIQLTGGEICLVDDEDFDFVSKIKWHIDSDGYARHGSKRMHRIIANTPKGMETDHINREKLDNRRSNLRVCTQHENQMNRGKQKNNKSGYKGVFSARKKWRPQIKYKGKVIRFGVFENIIDFD